MKQLGSILLVICLLCSFSIVSADYDSSITWEIDKKGNLDPVDQGTEISEKDQNALNTVGSAYSKEPKVTPEVKESISNFYDQINEDSKTEFEAPEISETMSKIGRAHV